MSPAARPLVLGHRGSPRGPGENTWRLRRGPGGRRRRRRARRPPHPRRRPRGPPRRRRRRASGSSPSTTWPTIRAALAWIPTLAEVLDECRGLLVNVEIKNSPEGRRLRPRRDGRGRRSSSCSRPGAARTGSSSPRSTCRRSTGSTPSPRTCRPATCRMRPAPLDAMAAPGRAGTGRSTRSSGCWPTGARPPWSRRPTPCGVAVNTWTVNEPEEMLRLAAAGVDAVVTDVPAEAVAVLT